MEFSKPNHGWMKPTVFSHDVQRPFFWKGELLFNHERGLHKCFSLRQSAARYFPMWSSMVELLVLKRPDIKFGTYFLHFIYIILKTFPLYHSWHIMAPSALLMVHNFKSNYLMGFGIKYIIFLKHFWPKVLQIGNIIVLVLDKFTMFSPFSMSADCRLWQWVRGMLEQVSISWSPEPLMVCCGI